MANLLKITGYTILDQIRVKSFYILLAIAIFFILFIRGCYEGSYNMNGQEIDNLKIAWNVSKIAFHVIAVFVYLLAAMLSMRIFKRDREDGSMAMFLARPITRWNYVVSRMFGVWVVSSLFLFVLHFTILCIAWAKTGGFIPGYMTASLICSANVLFVVVSVCLLSLFIPDFIAAIGVMVIIGVGIISDNIYIAMQSDLLKQAIPQNIDTTPALWRIMYPKIFFLQNYAVTLINKSEFHGMSSIHPALNIFIYSAIIIAVFIFSFNKKEI